MGHMATIVPVSPDTGSVLGAGGVPDAGLVDGLRAGSRDAFEQLYELYRARIYNLALRILQSPEDARDITQDVFIKVYRRLPGSRLTDLQLKPWLYRVAVNACYDHLRTRKVHRDIDIVSDTRAMPVDTFEQAEMSQLVEQTLGDLSERHRTVLVLKDIHGLRHDEIAGILGISRGATETLLFRARESFRTHYTDLTAELPAPACTFARDAAVTAIGGDLSGDERRRVMAHADHCPACRETVKTWGAAAVGLGMFLHGVPVPAALQGAFPFGAAATATGGAGAAAGAGTGMAGTGAGAGAGAAGASAAAGSAGAAAGGAAVTAGSATGLSLATGGILTKLGGAATVKIAALVVAATCTAGGGVAAYEADMLPGVHHRASTPAGVTAAHGGAAAAKDGEGTWTPPGLATAAANGGQGAERSAAAHAKDKGKGAAKKTAAGKKKGAANGKSGAQHGNAGGNGKGNGGADSNAGGNGNGNAGGNGKSGGSAKPAQATKPAKPDKPATPDKPAKPDKPTKPDKPAEPTTPHKPDKTQSG